MVRQTTFDKIRADFRIFAAKERLTLTVGFAIKLLLLTPGFQFVFLLRVQELLHAVPVVGRVLRRVVWWFSCMNFSSEIALGAEVDSGFYVPHPYGIVIGLCRIGRNVTVLQGVTIGKRNEADTTFADIGDEVFLGAGAVILGGIVIGEGAQIGANSVVLADVPAGQVAVGSPARVLRAGGGGRTEASPPLAPVGG